MKHKIKYVVGLFVMIGYMFCITGPTFATEISDAQSEVNNLEGKKKDLEKNIKELEKDKSNVLIYIEKLDKKLNQLTKDIKTSNTKIKKVQGNLEDAKVELEEAKKTEENQYKSMKTRIKYMYENGNSDYIDLILSADNLSDLLNRTEYIEKISEYDKGLLTRYQETKNAVIEKESQIESQLKELKTLNEELQIEQDGVNTLIDNKSAELKKYEKNIAKSQNEVEKFEAEIQKQEDLIENLLEQERQRVEAQMKKEEEARKAEAARKAAEEAKNTPDNQSTEETQETTVAEDNSSGFRWPLRVSGTITSTFGKRARPTAGASSNHKGIDIGVPTGTPIVAAGSGTVVTASYQSAAGNYVMIYHGNSTYTVYMHASALNVSVGQTVKKGDVIAYVGSTGASTGPHLHFGVSKNGAYVNPLDYVSR